MNLLDHNGLSLHSLIPADNKCVGSFLDAVRRQVYGYISLCAESMSYHTVGINHTYFGFHTFFCKADGHQTVARVRIYRA